MSSEQPMTDEGGGSVQTTKKTTTTHPEPESQTGDRINLADTDLLYRESEIPPWRFAFLCVGLGLGLFMAMMDASIVATSLYSIGSDLGDIEGINWVALAYTLAFLGCSVLFARVADIIGRRYAFIAAFIIFFSFSLGCGFARSITALIACRTFQGIGGSGLFSVTMIIFPELTPVKARNFIAPIIGMVISMAGVIGPILGGALSKNWSWVFWINGPLGFVSVVLFYCAWPSANYLPTIEQRSWRDLDFLGSFLVIAAAVLVTFSFQNAGVSGEYADPWKGSVFIAPLAVGVICWIALFMWEGAFERLWSHKMPALPLVLIRNHVSAASLLNTIFLGFAFLATLYAVPVRLQIVNGKTPIMSGVLMLPMLGATGVGSTLAGMLSSKQNRLWETMTVGTALVTLGLALETTVSDSADLEAKFLGFEVFIGLGYGMVTASATMFTSLEAPIPEHAPAQGLIAQARMLGGSIGIAMSSAVLALQQRNQLAGVIDPSKLGKLSQDMVKNLPEVQQAAIRKTYNDSFTEAMKVCAVVAGIGILITMGTYRRDRVPIQKQREQTVCDEIRRRRAEKEMPSSNSSGQSD